MREIDQYSPNELISDYRHAVAEQAVAGSGLILGCLDWRNEIKLYEAEIRRRLNLYEEDVQGKIRAASVGAAKVSC